MGIVWLKYNMFNTTQICLSVCFRPQGWINWNSAQSDNFILTVKNLIGKWLGCGLTFKRHTHQTHDWTYQLDRILQKPPGSRFAVCRRLSAENTRFRSFRCWSHTQEHNRCCTEKRGVSSIRKFMRTVLD